MSRRKRNRSLTIDKAQSRQAALLSVSPKLDFGNGLTSAAFDKLLAETRKAQNTYNTQLSQVDQSYNELQSLEKELADMSERMLIGVAAQYGKDSNEYEKAGGTRKSERRRSRRTATRQPAPVAG